MTKGEEIVAAIVSRLESITLLAGVYDWRTVNLDKMKLPAANVKDIGDTVNLSPTQRTYVQLEKISVELIVSGRDKEEKQDSEDPAITLLRAITEAVETILIKENQTLGKIIHRLIYTGSTMASESRGDLTVIVRTLTFDAEWFRNVFPP